MKKRNFWRFIALLPLLLIACIDPVEPEFEFREGLVFVEGFASTSERSSFVIINKSVTEFGIDKTIFEKGATVVFINSDTNEVINLIEQEAVYVPPIDFKVATGERWELLITLADGVQYKSTPEQVLEAVSITDIKANYNPELQFDEGSGDFEPGHSVAVSFTDPAVVENFYYWTFRSYENLTICETCFDGILRNGNCESTAVNTPPYFSYQCDTDCWRIRFPESISIFDDKFTDGRTTTDLAVGNVPLYTKENMVVEVQQFSLTPDAYDYYKVLKDIVDNSSGFNAPPPAALIGNLTNPNDTNDFVFGRFTAAATSTASIFIDRFSIEEDAIEPNRPAVYEPTLLSPYPPPATITTTCSENRFRTAIQPEAWMQ